MEDNVTGRYDDMTIILAMRSLVGPKAKGV